MTQTDNNTKTKDFNLWQGYINTYNKMIRGYKIQKDDVLLINDQYCKVTALYNDGTALTEVNGELQHIKREGEQWIFAD